MANLRAQKPSQRRHLFQGAHDPNSLLHGGFDYIERGGDGVQVPLLPGDRGRRHLTMADSVTEEFRPSRRVLPPSFSGAQHPRPQGLAKVEPCIQKSPREAGIRTNATAARRSGYDIPDPGLVLQSKHTVTDDTGRAARDRISGELTLEKAFGLKRMVKTQRERRGGMPAKGNPGDNFFHHVENSPGFHQAGELSVGSSFYRTMPRRGGGGLRGPAAATAAPDGVGYASGAGGYGNQRKMSFREARREASYVESLREVLELTEALPAAASAAATVALPTAVAGGDETCASWEERTGMHTWRRKNKPLTAEAAAAAAAATAAGTGTVPESGGVAEGGG